MAGRDLADTQGLQAPDDRADFRLAQVPPGMIPVGMRENDGLHPRGVKAELSQV